MPSSVPTLRACVSCLRADGCLEVFGVQFNREVCHIRQTKPNGGWEPQWKSLGEIAGSAPAVVVSPDGPLDVVIAGELLELRHRHRPQPTRRWKAWHTLGDPPMLGPAAALNWDGRLELFARRSGDELWRTAEKSTGGGWPQQPKWDSLYGETRGRPVVDQNMDGRLELFARDPGNFIVHVWQIGLGNPSQWSEWQPLGPSHSAASDPACGRNADGRLEVFIRGEADDELWHIWQTVPGKWSGWESLRGEITSAPAVGVNADGRLEVFARGADDALWHIWQTVPGKWSDWHSLGGFLTSEPSCARNHDGRLEVFARGGDNALWHIWQTAKSGGWSAWLGGPPSWSSWDSRGGALITH